MSTVLLAPAAWQTAFVVLVVCLTPLCETAHLRRLQHFTTSGARSSVLRGAALRWWIYALLAVLLAGPLKLFMVTHADVDMPWLFGNTVGLVLGTGLLLIYFALALAAGLQCALRSETRRRYALALRSLHYMLPVSDGERRWWVLISITAGVCEEVFFRGFLLQFLHGQLDGGWHLGLTGAWLLSSLVFGCGHAYQGVGGVIRTTLAGAMFGLLAIVSGSLLLPIVLHVLVDLAVLWIYRPQLDDPALAARLMQGCSPSAIVD